jgi:hypothetical protein
VILSTTCAFKRVFFASSGKVAIPMPDVFSNSPALGAGKPNGACASQGCGNHPAPPVMT